MALPDFLLLGAPKAGTTALHVALSRHPQLFLSANKEPKFFLTDGPPPRGGGPGDDRTYQQYVWRREDYEALFADAPEGALKGESTTLYLRDPQAHCRIAALVPDARLVAVLRDPVDRAHSNWVHLRSAGLEPESDFLRACEREQERAAAGWGPFWRYVGLGRYGEQLTSLYAHFPREQVLLLLYRDVRQSPATALDRICRHLGVQTGVVTQLSAENVTAHASPSLLNGLLSSAVRALPRLTRPLPGRLQELAAAPAARLLQREQRTRTPLTPQERTALLPAFADDIDAVEELTGLQLDHWRDPRNGGDREPLDVRGRFGTAFTSIDRPLQH